MTHAYDEMYVDDAMHRLGDMLEYACLDCGYDPDAYWRMFLYSKIARRFEVGDVSVVAGRSGPELAYMVLDEVDHRKDLPEPVWRENRSDIYWCGWLLAYYQWKENVSFSDIWDSVSLRMLQKMYPTMHEADIEKSVEAIERLRNRPEKRAVRNLRLTRGLTQAELAERAKMTLSQLQRLEYGERKVDNMTLKSALMLADALNVSVEELR